MPGTIAGLPENDIVFAEFLRNSLVTQSFIQLISVSSKFEMVEIGMFSSKFEHGSKTICVKSEARSNQIDRN